mmetsp:Transcript_62753/g.152793  ORF Transcript_62753/g.152793 Transcript_62753/m.152793 type:complete len:534 (-) Transcript_62753:156-1757(-)
MTIRSTWMLSFVAGVVVVLTMTAGSILAQEDQQQDVAGGTEDGTAVIAGNLISLCELDDRIVDEPCTEQNRYCLSIQPLEEGGETTTTNGGIIRCGPCLQGFVELGPDDVCTDINTITWETFEELYAPIFSSPGEDGGTVPTQERLELLIEAAILISLHNARAELADVIGADVTLEDTAGAVAAAYTLGLTKFSADTAEDYKARSGYRFVNVTGTPDELPRRFPTVSSSASGTSSGTGNGIPDRIDWVELGGSTSVKDQGRCGSCWAVSLSGAIEGAAFANNGYQQSVSFQQFVSCNKQNLGCDGGNLVIAALYSVLNDFDGVARLNEYEYTDYRGETTEECKVDTVDYPRAVEVSKPEVVAGFDFFGSFDDRLREFKEALAEKPVAMVIRSSCKTLSNYKKGIMTDDGDCACSAVDCIDHAVLMVGYDDTDPTPYFKLKNSWGDDWGEGGYFRIAQTEKGRFGLFGMLAEGVVVDAQNVTVQVYDEEQETPFDQWWVILLIVLAGVCLICVCFGVIRRMRTSSDPKDSPSSE